MLNRSRWWCIVKTRSHYHSVNPIPEHPACLISKETAKNKACQTHQNYDARWPERYMEPTEYVITPRDLTDKRTNQTTRVLNYTNDKGCQTNIKHVYNSRMTLATLKNTKCVQLHHVPIPTQLDDYSSDQPQTATGGDAGTSSRNDEESRLAQLLGSISMTSIKPL